MALAQPQNKLNILIVEDNLDDALILKRHLSHKGQSAYTRVVDNEDDFSQAIENYRWDLILADYELPGFSAMRALEIVNERRLHVPFIIISGVMEDVQAARAMEVGASDFFSKWEVDRLLPAIHRELERHQQRRTLHILRQDLTQQYAKINLLLKVAPVNIWAWNSQSEQFIYSDQLSMPVLASPMGEYGKLDDFVAMMPENDARQFRQMIFLAMNTREIQMCQYQIRTQDEQTHWLQSMCQGIRETGDDVVAYVLGVTLDVSSAQQAANRQADMQAQMREYKAQQDLQRNLLDALMQSVMQYEDVDEIASPEPETAPNAVMVLEDMPKQRRTVNRDLILRQMKHLAIEMGAPSRADLSGLVRQAVREKLKGSSVQYHISADPITDIVPDAKVGFLRTVQCFLDGLVAAGQAVFFAEFDVHYIGDRVYLRCWADYEIVLDEKILAMRADLIQAELTISQNEGGTEVRLIWPVPVQQD